MNNQAKSHEAILNEITNLQSRISSLQEALPYADGPAYYQDKRRIAELTNQIGKLKIELAKTPLSPSN